MQLFLVLFIQGKRVLNGPCHHPIRDGKLFVNKKIYLYLGTWMASGQNAVQCRRCEAVTELPQLEISVDHSFSFVSQITSGGQNPSCAKGKIAV